MRIIFLILISFMTINAQSNLLTLFADDGITYSAEATQYFAGSPAIGAGTNGNNIGAK